MSKGFKRILSGAIAVTIAASFTFGLTGCDNNNNNGKITLTFWEQDAPDIVDPIWDRIIKEFEAKNPNVEISRTHTGPDDLTSKYQNAVAGGQGPSLVSCPDDNIGVFGTAKTVIPLDDFFSKDFFSTLDQDVLNGIKLNGKIYGIPYKIGNCICLLYNKKLVNKVPETMDELIAKAKELTNVNERKYGFVFNMGEPFFYMSFLGGYGGRVMDEKGNITLNTEAMKKMVQLLYDFKYTHKIVPLECDYNVANSLFKDGKSAFTLNGPWTFDEYAKAGIDLGIARIPKTTEGIYPAPYKGSKVLMVNPNLNDQQKQAVKSFIEFINQKDNQIDLALATDEIPTNLEAKADAKITENDQIKRLANQMEVGIQMPIVPEIGAIWLGVKPVFRDVFAGKVKPQDAPKKMQISSEKKVKEMYGTIKK